MFRRLLLAIDHTSSADVGVSLATALAGPDGGAVHVVHANVFVGGGRGMTYETGDEAGAVVGRAVAELVGSGVAASGEVVLATTFTLGSRLAAAAARWGADVIVLGSQRHRRLPRLVGLGVRDQVVRHTPLPVLTAPSPLRLPRHAGPGGRFRHLHGSMSTGSGSI